MEEILNSLEIHMAEEEIDSERNMIEMIAEGTKIIEIEIETLPLAVTEKETSIDQGVATIEEDLIDLIKETEKKEDLKVVKEEEVHL